MILLSLDSTEITASAAVTDGRRLVAQTVVRSGHTHSETLLPAISFIMKSAALSFEELNGFACSVGPGSFTGVRIGVATIKGLAFGRGKPCIGVSALEAMAYALGDCGGVICPVMDARRNQLYNAVFRACGGTVARLTPDRVIAAGDLAGELRIKYRNEPIFLCGEGSGVLRGAGISRCRPAITGSRSTRPKPAAGSRSPSSLCKNPSLLYSRRERKGRKRYRGSNFSLIERDEGK